jgi:pyroglutamyl-peptidase
MRLRRSLLPAACVLAAILAAGAVYADRTPLRVMITGFQPFEGRDVNNSWQIASAISAARAQLGDGVEISTCLLPVVYDSAARVAEGCFENATDKPDVVLSLGEVGCKLRLETRALNKDDVPGFPDNAGNIRAGLPIRAGAGETIGFNLPTQEMYCALDKNERAEAAVSRTASFVCNNTAFRLAEYFAGRGTAATGAGAAPTPRVGSQGLPVQFGFIHVPTSDCSNEGADPATNAKKLIAMVARLAAYDAAPPPASGAVANVLPHCSNVARLPASAAEISNLLATLTDLANDDCRREFLDRLKETE